MHLQDLRLSAIELPCKVRAEMLCHLQHLILFIYFFTSLGSGVFFFFHTDTLCNECRCISAALHKGSVGSACVLTGVSGGWV